MFTYNQIAHLISKTARSILQDEEQFAQISEAVTELIANITDYTAEELAKEKWVKTPFVFLTEYFVYNRLDAPTQEFISKAENYYRNALKILKQNKKSITASKLGTMEGLYDAEF